MKYAEKVNIINFLIAMEELADYASSQANDNPYETATGEAIAYGRIRGIFEKMPVDDPEEEMKHER